MKYKDLIEALKPYAEEDVEVFCDIPLSNTITFTHDDVREKVAIIKLTEI